MRVSISFVFLMVLLEAALDLVVGVALREASPFVAALRYLAAAAAGGLIVAASALAAYVSALAVWDGDVDDG